MFWKRGAVAMVVVGLCSLAQPRGLVAQDEIQIDGVSVVTTATDQDTTYAGQMCPVGSALVGFSESSELICDCFPGFSLCGEACFDLQTDSNHCGSCETVCTGNDICFSGSCGECSTTLQNCPDLGDGCYPNIIASTTTCEPEGSPLGQGEECSEFNDCEIGYGCSVLNGAQDSLVCARLCDPDDPTGPNGTPRCVADLGSGYSCVRATDYWADLEPNMESVGWCLDAKLMAGPLFFDPDRDW